MFSDLRTWAWITLILGAVSILAAFGIVSGAQWARWFGIVIAAINAIGQLAWIQAYPWWSLAIFTIDILIIYALTVYGGKERPRPGSIATRLVGAPAPGRPHGAAHAANCASSVDPFSASVEAIPPEITWATWSK